MTLNVTGTVKERSRAEISAYTSLNYVGPGCTVEFNHSRHAQLCIYHWSFKCGFSAFRRIILYTFKCLQVSC